MKQSIVTPHSLDEQYDTVFREVTGIVEAARQSAARSVNAFMTGAYWMIGRHIVEFEQSGEERATYGANLIEKLATDMTRRFGRGFSRQNLWQMRQFGLAYPPERILQTLSGESEQPLPRSLNLQTASGDSSGTFTKVRLEDLIASFPLPWSAYVRLRGGATRRMVRPPTRPADQLPVLRAHRAVPRQGGHARSRQQGAG